MKTIASILIFFFMSLCISHSAKVKLGVDVLIESEFALLYGKKVALLTNQSGRNSDGYLTAEIFAKSGVVNLTSIFVPEHGLFGASHAGAKVENESFMGIPVYSLYGNVRNPFPEQIKSNDIIVVDLQDIGIRSYTFLSTMYYMIKAAAEHDKPVMILDRPNPIGGNIIDGAVLEKGRESFVGIIPISYIHGLTFGELANMISAEGWLGKNKNGKALKADITVIKMKNWSRNMPFEETGLTWFPTSPHIPSVDAVRGAAVLGIFGELGFINIGIGTTLPFQYIGSPQFKTNQILSELSDGREFAGLELHKARYKPFYAKYNNEFCEGVLLRFPHSNKFLPYQAGAKIFLAVKKYHPELFKENAITKNSKDMFVKVTGADDYFNALFNSTKSENVLKAATRGLNEFKKLRTKYLLY